MKEAKSKKKARKLPLQQKKGLQEREAQDLMREILQKNLETFKLLARY
ncbi:hypothetical protein FJNA_07000 [Thermus sp. FJN-A]